MINQRKPHSFKKKKLIWRQKQFWQGIAFFLFFFSLSYILFFHQTFQIDKIVIAGEKKISKENLESFINAKLDSNRLLFFQTKSIFLINCGILEKNILKNYSGLANLKIKRNFPAGLTFILEERVEAANWCRQGRCFLIDKEGIIFREESKEDLAKIVDNHNSGDLQLGQRVMSKEELNQIISGILPALGNLAIEPAQFSASEDKLEVLTKENWKIFFDLQKDIDWQLTKLDAVLRDSIPQDKRRNLDYIELRFGNFAPFKYR